MRGCVHVCACAPLFSSVSCAEKELLCNLNYTKSKGQLQTVEQQEALFKLSELSGGFGEGRGGHERAGLHQSPPDFLMQGATFTNIDAHLLHKHVPAANRQNQDDFSFYFNV